LFRRALTLLAACFWLIVVAAPLYYLVVVSIEPEATFFNASPWFPTAGVTLGNYATVVDSGFFTYLRNSLIVSGGTTLMALAVSLPCAYAIVRRRSRATGTLFRVFLTGFAVPVQALMVPLYIEVLRLHLFDTLIGLILPLAAFSLPITILILVNFLRDVPSSLIDAMEVDGAGQVRVLISLVVPSALPALLTVGIYNFIMSWNNFLFPLLLTQSAGTATIPLAVFNFEGNYLQNVPDIMASVALFTAPLVLLYLVARRQMLKGLGAAFGV
jgi:raffinose/stachyose/melibiose transport system permease protein